MVSVLWDDLALTIAPVNPTVGSAVSMAKSLSSAEFVKALTAGYGTDSSAFTGGRALQKEDAGHEKIPLSANAAFIAGLVGAIADGTVTDLEEAELFLADYGISNADAREIIRAVCKKSNIFTEVLPMAKSSFWDKIKNDLRKSISGKKPEDDEEPKENPEGSNPDDEDDDEEYEDAGPIVKALSEKVGELQTTIETMAKAQAVML